MSAEPKSGSAAGISAEGPDRPPAAPAGIFGALLEFQKRAPKIQKDGINPHFGSRYPTYETVLAAILPELNDCELILVQEPTFIENDQGEFVPCLTTRIIHVPSCEEIKTTMVLLATKADPQGQGSAIKYACRYSLMAMLALSADPDDDGNRAVQSAPAGKPEAKGGHSASERGTTQPEQSVPREQKPATGPQRDRLLELTDRLAGAGQIATEAAEKLSAAAAKPELLRGKAAELIERLEAVEKKVGGSGAE